MDLYYACQTIFCLCFMFIIWKSADKVSGINTIFFLGKNKSFSPPSPSPPLKVRGISIKVKNEDTTPSKIYQWSLRIAEYGSAVVDDVNIDDTELSSNDSNGSTKVIFPSSITLGKTMPRRKESKEYPSTTRESPTTPPTDDDNVEDNVEKKDVEKKDVGASNGVTAYWDHCPASMIVVRDGPTIAEYKRTRSKRSSSNAMYDILTGDLNTTSKQYIFFSFLLLL
jgi:hypothetical protein